MTYDKMKGTPGFARRPYGNCPLCGKRGIYYEMTSHCIWEHCRYCYEYRRVASKKAGENTWTPDIGGWSTWIDHILDRHR